ncbi:hypothetical protein BJ166DRAFT_530898 [Pestalotiopsis sp. NC0098]|nr:hypothetical protein BJ166DRAFT_530898 [Pestalotiopsis sp. NC0098]
MQPLSKGKAVLAMIGLSYATLQTCWMRDAGPIYVAISCALIFTRGSARRSISSQSARNIETTHRTVYQDQSNGDKGAEYGRHWRGPHQR